MARVCGAALADAGDRRGLLRGSGAAGPVRGLLGHLAEEMRPVGNAIYQAVDRNAVYLPPD
jgi:hypothetical protein